MIGDKDTWKDDDDKIRDFWLQQYRYGMSGKGSDITAKEMMDMGKALSEGFRAGLEGSDDE